MRHRAPSHKQRKKHRRGKDMTTKTKCSPKGGKSHTVVGVEPKTGGRPGTILSVYMKDFLGIKERTGSPTCTICMCEDVVCD